MANLIVHGGKPLTGRIVPSANKNAVLPILCATLLTHEPVRLIGIPEITDVRKILEIFRTLGSARLGCPFVGPTPPDRAIGFAREIWEMGIDELAIADTIGYAHPLEVGRLFEAIGRFAAMDRLAAHLHDTQAMGLANSVAAISAGVRVIDSSVGGLGGCPFAPGAAGNLATEDLAFMLYKMGMGTGIDLQALWTIVHELEQIIGRPLGGRLRAWWESQSDEAPTLQQP